MRGGAVPDLPHQHGPLNPAGKSWRCSVSLIMWIVKLCVRLVIYGLFLLAIVILLHFGFLEKTLHCVISL